MHLLHIVLSTFLKVLTRTIVEQSRVSLVGDNVLNSHDLNVCDAGVLLKGEIRF